MLDIPSCRTKCSIIKNSSPPKCGGMCVGKGPCSRSLLLAFQGLGKVHLPEVVKT